MEEALRRDGQIRDTDHRVGVHNTTTRYEPWRRTNPLSTMLRAGLLAFGSRPSLPSKRKDSSSSPGAQSRTNSLSSVQAAQLPLQDRIVAYRRLHTSDIGQHPCLHEWPRWTEK